MDSYLSLLDEELYTGGEFRVGPRMSCLAGLQNPKETAKLTWNGN
jgi:hypothetical protein